MDASILTRFLVLSDTHGDTIDIPEEEVDVVIHCGDMTEESKLDEFWTTIDMLKKIQAPQKLIIPGNHDFTLDVPMFQRKLAEAKLTENDDAVIKAYGSFGEAQKLFDQEDAKRAGLVLLTEGTHRFILANGASLTVYASPYTPSTNDWGFQYDPAEDHVWDIATDVNVAITHGPGLGVFDQTASNKRAGSASLFKAIAHSRPQMHCFGHMHASWGAKTVTWREDIGKDAELSHFTAIDNDKSSLVESLATLQPRKFDTDEIKEEKKAKLEAYTKQRYCVAADGVEAGKQTLFVNAAVEGSDEYPKHLLWMVQIGLPRAESSRKRTVVEVDESDDVEEISKRALPPSMEHADGIRTRMRTRDGLMYPQTDNPLVELGTHGLGGKGMSKLVNIVPGQEVHISIDFDFRFDLGAADGIQIVISTGRATPRASEFSNAQALWVPASDVKESTIHITSVHQWNKQGRDDGNKALLAPKHFDGRTSSGPSRYRAPEMYNSNEWAITIYVQRVYLRRSSKEVIRRYASVDGLATIPPECYLVNVGVDSGRQVINPHWVTALEDAAGEPYIFEFLNTALAGIPAPGAAADSATGVPAGIEQRRDPGPSHGSNGMARAAASRSGVDGRQCGSADDDDDEESRPVKRARHSQPLPPREETPAQEDATQRLVPAAATVEVPMATPAAASMTYRWDERAQLEDEIRLLELRMKLREMDRRAV